MCGVLRYLVELRIKVAGGKMPFPDRYRLWLLNIALIGDDIWTAWVKTTADWGINWAGGFARDNQSLLKSVRWVGGRNSGY
tara:strand:- start:250 stop:492 length:243 start_codon:yes stop_codon:yes gene_type:complete